MGLPNVQLTNCKLVRRQTQIAVVYTKHDVVNKLAFNCSYLYECNTLGMVAIGPRKLSVCINTRNVYECVNDERITRSDRKPTVGGWCVGQGNLNIWNNLFWAARGVVWIDIHGVDYVKGAVLGSSWLSTSKFIYGARCIYRFHQVSKHAARVRGCNSTNTWGGAHLSSFTIADQSDRFTGHAAGAKNNSVSCTDELQLCVNCNGEGIHKEWSDRLW